MNKMEIVDFKTECILVEASKLSLFDTFMQRKPKTKEQEALKKMLTDVIKNGIDDFYRPTMDPSFIDEKKSKIQFVAGEKPAIGESYAWWENKLKESAWCFGTKEQYVAFLGVLIKKLVANAFPRDLAWELVCNESSALGHYRHSKNAKGHLEDTGSREICGFYDLANTSKILAKDPENGDFSLASGAYDVCGFYMPLAYLGTCLNDYQTVYENTVPWLVLNLC